VADPAAAPSRESTADPAAFPLQKPWGPTGRAGARGEIRSRRAEQGREAGGTVTRPLSSAISLPVRSSAEELHTRGGAAAMATASCSTTRPSSVPPLSFVVLSSPARLLNDDGKVAWAAHGRSEEQGREAGGRRGRREAGGGKRRRERQPSQTMHDGCRSSAGRPPPL
jgi:hypothetical protein